MLTLVHGQVTDFPRRVFTDLDECAIQAGLCPRALLNLSKRC